MPHRATKIVATLGPASSDPALLMAMINAGVNVVRLNFSHGKAQDHIDRATLVREAAKRAGREVAIMADLQGPKIRVGKFAEGKVMLEQGAAFVLDASRTEPGDVRGVGLDYKELPRDVRAGDLLLLNDGLIVLAVQDVRGEAVHTVVKMGGELSNNKGTNKQGGGLTAPALRSICWSIQPTSPQSVSLPPAEAWWLPRSTFRSGAAWWCATRGGRSLCCST